MCGGGRGPVPNVYASLSLQDDFFILQQDGHVLLKHSRGQSHRKQCPYITTFEERRTEAGKHMRFAETTTRKSISLQTQELMTTRTYLFLDWLTHVPARCNDNVKH